MKIFAFVFLCFCQGWATAQTPTASQTAHNFYSWYLTKGVNTGWKQAVKRPELSAGLQKKLTVFFQKMEKDNEGGYDPILQAQDYEEKFTLKPVTQTTAKATFYLILFEQKTALVTLTNVNNKWLIDTIQGVQ
ncbi:MAG: DUF3828 domain-containing protein [Spirosomataceae bacterium]